MTWRPPVRFVGVGSPNGDDAVAWAVVRRVQERLTGVDCRCLHGGQQLLDLLDGQGTLVLIDAVVSGAPSGTIQRRVSRLRLRRNDPFRRHHRSTVRSAWRIMSSLLAPSPATLRAMAAASAGL